jgi:hypothetical protein
MANPRLARFLRLGLFSLYLLQGLFVVVLKLSGWRSARLRAPRPAYPWHFLAFNIVEIFGLVAHFHQRATAGPEEERRLITSGGISRSARQRRRRLR